MATKVTNPIKVQAQLKVAHRNPTIKSSVAKALVTVKNMEIVLDACLGQVSGSEPKASDSETHPCLQQQVVKLVSDAKRCLNKLTEVAQELGVKLPTDSVAENLNI